MATPSSISPEWLVKFHGGYELDENDYHDVRLLCERFGIAMPDQYRMFTRRVPEADGLQHWPHSVSTSASRSLVNHSDAKHPKLLSFRICSRPMGVHIRGEHNALAVVWHG